MEEGIGYALFHSNKYKQAKKTMKIFILHLAYVYPRSLAEAVIKKKELHRVYWKIKARKDALSHAEKSNTEMLFMLMRDEAKKDVRHCNNMRVASDDKTQLSTNMDQQHLSTTRASRCSSKMKLTRYVNTHLL